LTKGTRKKQRKRERTANFENSYKREGGKRGLKKGGTSLRDAGMTHPVGVERK